MTPTSGNPPSGGEEEHRTRPAEPSPAQLSKRYTRQLSTTVALSQEAVCCDHRQNPPTVEWDAEMRLARGRFALPGPRPGLVK